MHLERKKRLGRYYKHQWGVLGGVQKVFVTCRTMERCACGLTWCCPGVWCRKTRGSSTRVLRTCRWKCDLSWRNLDQGTEFQPDRLLLARFLVPRTPAVCRCSVSPLFPAGPRSRGGSGGECAIAQRFCINSKKKEKHLAFVVLSFKQQAVVSFCSAVWGGREPRLSKV